MQYVGYAELAAAVSNAGGLGTISALTAGSAEKLTEEIRKFKTLSDKPFAVNFTILPSMVGAPSFHPLCLPFCIAMMTYYTPANPNKSEQSDLLPLT